MKNSKENNKIKIEERIHGEKIITINILNREKSFFSENLSILLREY